jgi:hypothetical protein
MARQGNTTSVGLGYQHQQARRHAINAMTDGTPCPLCGRPMHRNPDRNPDGRALHYDHVIPRRLGGGNGPRRLTHALCNVRAGSALGNAIRWGRPHRRTREYTRW